MRLLTMIHSLYVSSRTHLLPPASAAATVDITPNVDLDTGGVIALHAPGDGHGNIPPAIRTVLQISKSEALLPLVLPVPSSAVIGGSASLAPLHEALRTAGRRPREVILM